MVMLSGKTTEGGSSSGSDTAGGSSSGPFADAGVTDETPAPESDCSLSRDVGVCRGSFIRYHFNLDTKSEYRCIEYHMERTTAAPTTCHDATRVCVLGVGQCSLVDPQHNSCRPPASTRHPRAFQ